MVKQMDIIYVSVAQGEDSSMYVTLRYNTF